MAQHLKYVDADFQCIDINKLIFQKTVNSRFHCAYLQPKNSTDASKKEGYCPIYCLMINDISISPQTNLALFADDTTVFTISIKAAIARGGINNHSQFSDIYFEK